MKKKIRRRPPDEIKVIVNKKRDEMENIKPKDSVSEWFRRKPYDFGKGNNGTEQKKNI